jgi:hypothetical protein
MDRYSAQQHVIGFYRLVADLEAQANQADDNEPVFVRLKWLNENRAEYLRSGVNGKAVRRLTPQRYVEIEDALFNRLETPSSTKYRFTSEIDELKSAYDLYLQAWPYLDGRRHPDNSATTLNKEQTVKAAKKSLSKRGLTEVDLSDGNALHAFLNPIFLQRQKGSNGRAVSLGRQLYAAFTNWPDQFKITPQVAATLRLNILIRVAYAAYQQNLHARDWALREIALVHKDCTSLAHACKLHLTQHEGYTSRTSDAGLRALALGRYINDSNRSLPGYDLYEGGLFCNAGATASGLGHDLDAKICVADDLTPRMMFEKARQLDREFGDHEGAAFSASAFARALLRNESFDAAHDIVQGGFRDFESAGITAPYAKISLYRTRALIYSALAQKDADTKLAKLAGTDFGSAVETAKHHDMHHLIPELELAMK